jgi:predicted small secreted protein
MCANSDPFTRVFQEIEMKPLLSILLLAATLLSLSACNTVAGVGQDLKAGGQAITNAADKSK